MKKIILIFTSALVLILVAQSCKTVDLRSDYLIENSSKIDMRSKGLRLLEETNRAMGYDQLNNVKVYEVTAKFTWQPALLIMPMNSLPGNNQNDIQFRFATNTFDGQVEYLEGRKENQIYGLQSWQGYRYSESNKELKTNNSARYNWGLATYHYLLEAPMRLLNAEIIKYAGEREFNGQNYDLVFVSWGSEKPNKKYDQWLVYINKDTKFIDLTEITIGDFFVPMPKGMQHGTIQFPQRSKTSIGTYFPTEVAIQIGKPKHPAKDAYRFRLRDFKFDSFDKNVLYPLDGLDTFGDSKPKELFE